MRRVGSIASWPGRVLATCLIVLAALSVWVFRSPLFGENFDVVDSGRVYRSAQPAENLRNWITNYKIVSILNLRGGTMSDGFYRNEMRVADASSVALYELPMSATERPRRKDMLRMIQIFDECRYPLLVHCKKGSDRTAFACAVYRMIRLGESPTEAESAFDLGHAHLPLLGPERLHEPLNEYHVWLEQRGLSHTPARFRYWVETQYRESADHVVRVPLALDGFSR